LIFSTCNHYPSPVLHGSINRATTSREHVKKAHVHHHHNRGIWKKGNMSAGVHDAVLWHSFGEGYMIGNLANMDRGKVVSTAKREGKALGGGMG